MAFTVNQAFEQLSTSLKNNCCNIDGDSSFIKLVSNGTTSKDVTITGNKKGQARTFYVTVQNKPTNYTTNQFVTNIQSFKNKLIDSINTNLSGDNSSIDGTYDIENTNNSLIDQRNAVFFMLTENIISYISQTTYPMIFRFGGSTTNDSYGTLNSIVLNGNTYNNDTNYYGIIYTHKDIDISTYDNNDPRLISNSDTLSEVSRYNRYFKNTLRRALIDTKTSSKINNKSTVQIYIG